MGLREQFFIDVMNVGLDKAASSFGQLINRPIKSTANQSILIRHKGDFSYINEKQGNLFVLITQVIGAVSGKSFLLISEDESREIFSSLKSMLVTPILKDAFLMEIDNILSASVISEMSNSFNLEIYGDVPRLYKMHARELPTFLEHEIAREDSSSIIVSNTTFQFSNKEKFQPQFVWKLNDKIFELIPEHRVTV